MNQPPPVQSFNAPPVTLQTIMTPSIYDGGIQTITNIVSSEQQGIGEFQIYICNIVTYRTDSEFSDTILGKV